MAVIAGDPVGMVWPAYMHDSRPLGRRHSTRVGDASQYSHSNLIPIIRMEIIRMEIACTHIVWELQREVGTTRS